MFSDAFEPACWGSTQVGSDAMAKRSVPPGFGCPALLVDDASDTFEEAEPPPADADAALGVPDESSLPHAASTTPMVTTAASVRARCEPRPPGRFNDGRFHDGRFIAGLHDEFRSRGQS